jgi:hypothetical protein
MDVLMPRTQEVQERLMEVKKMQEQFSSDVQEIQVLRSHDCMDLGTPFVGCAGVTAKQEARAEGRE